MKRIARDIIAERKRQHAKWGQQDLPDGTGPDFSFYGHHFDELRSHSQGVCDAAAKNGTLTYRHIELEEIFEAMAESDPVKLRAELIQAIAVMIQHVQCIDRREA